jgi:Rrf2 family protein
MLKLTKKVEYALISLVHLSEEDNGCNASAKKIADKYDMPKEILAKTLQNLSSLGMIKSIQGPKGGYQISCNINEINIFEFIQMIEGPIGLVDCTLPNGCISSACCTIKDPMAKINNKIIDTLKDITLDELR